MTFNEEDKIIINIFGKNKEYYKLIQFKNNDKDYLIYTDGKYTNNKLNIYSNILKEKRGNIEFIPITEEEDIETVKRVLIGQKIKISK